MACEICKQKGELSDLKLTETEIFYVHQTIRIKLCHAHDRELFIQGQMRFLTKYKEILSSKYEPPPRK